MSLVEKGFEVITRKPIKIALAFAVVALIASGIVVFAWKPAKGVQAAPSPALSGSIGTHDPSRIIKDGNRYYFYSTGYNIPAATSTDGIHWTSSKAVLPSSGTFAWARKAVPGNDGHNIWAPDVIYNNGLFYLYYAIAGTKYYTAIGLVTSPTLNPNAPNYKWTDRGEVIGTNTSNRYSAIDPAPYFDAQGNLWLSFGSGYIFKPTEPQIFEIRLNKSTGLRADNVVHAVSNGHEEASYVYHHGSYYYLFWNTGGCCSGAASTYLIHVARSTSVTGPYVGSSGAANSSNTFLASHGNVHGPGQIGILDQGGVSYYSYHYYPASGYSVLGEGVLNWSASGWPIASSGVITVVPQPTATVQATPTKTAQATPTKTVQPTPTATVQATPTTPSSITLSGSIGTHDPSRIIKDGNRYYFYSTGYNIPAATSTDGIHWTSSQSVLPSSGTFAWARTAVPGNDGHNIWAPDVIYNNGLFYLYYAIAGTKYYTAIGLVTSPTLNPSAPNYKWTDRGEVIGTTIGIPYSAIDPAPYFDASGNLWLSFGSGYIFKPTQPQIFEIRLNNSTGLRADNVVYPVSNGHEEASYVYHHGSYYYLFWNTGGCCSGAASTYLIHVARSTSVTGPYVGSSGAANSSNTFLASHGNVHGPGQIGIRDEGGVSYYTYHYYPASGYSVLGEGVLNWSASGWPIAN